MNKENKKVIGWILIIIAILLFINQQETDDKKEFVPAYAMAEMAGALALTGTGIVTANPALITIGIILGALFLITIIGGGIFISNLGQSPWLILALVVGAFMLLKNLKRK